MTTPATGPPDVVAGRQYDAALHLLDRQLVDPDGRLVAKVDDLELTERADGRLAVSAVLTGPGALGPRLGGRSGHWVQAVWRRLRPDVDPAPGRIPISDVVRIDSAVHLAVRRDTLERVGIDGFEDWVRRYVVARLPGAGHDPE